MRRIVGFALIALSSLYLGACGASKTPAEAPVTLEDYLVEGWDAYSKFDFVTAKSAFKRVIDADAQNTEAYLGYMLSNLSLGDYAQATSYSSIALFIVDPTWTRVKTGSVVLTQDIIDSICTTRVVSMDSTVVDMIIDSTVTPPETTYIYEYKYYGRYVLKLADGNLIYWGRLSARGNKASYTIVATDGEYIMGDFLGANWDYREADTLTCTMFHPGDTLEYSYDYTSNVEIDSLGLDVMVSSAAANLFSEEYRQAMKVANATFRKTVSATPIADRIPVRYTFDDLKYLVLKTYFAMENYYMLTMAINRYFDPAFPYSGWSFSNLDDLEYVDENIDLIKNKYYELLTGATVLFKIKNETKRR